MDYSKIEEELEKAQNRFSGLLSDSQEGVATLGSPSTCEGLREAPTLSERVLESKATLLEKIEEEYRKIERGEIDPKNKLEMVTLRHLERKYRRLTRAKRRRVHGRIKKNRERKLAIEKSLRDMYSNWVALKESSKLFHRWALSFEDWMDVMEFIREKWGIEEPWKESLDWRFRREGDWFNLDRMYIEHKKTGDLLFCPYEFKMWKNGDVTFSAE
jgi:hypothetical protein